MTKKLQNIKAITEMLGGQHHSQTTTGLGWDDVKRKEEQSKIRRIGEEWPEYDKDGKIIHIWIQKDGYRIKKPPHYKILKDLKEYLNSYPNCLTDCETAPEDRTRLDERFRAKFGRCADCQFRIENMKKLNGEWKEYELQQMKENADAFFKQADKEIKTVTNQLREGIGYVNSNGTQEEWKDTKNIADQIESEYNQYKEIVLQKLSGVEDE